MFDAFRDKFLSVVATLRQDDSIVVVAAELVPPAPGELAEVERVLGYSLGASITEFYAACGGVRLIWTPVDPDEDGIWTAERAARVFAEPSKCGPWLFKSGDHVGTPQGCIWIPSCKQVFGNPAQWSDLLGSQDDVFDDYREQLGQPDAAECLAPFDYASAFYDFAFLLNGKPMWKPGGGTRAHRRARNCWASMSAWAVPLRQGALKETRTRPMPKAERVIGDGAAGWEPDARCGPEIGRASCRERV